MPKRFIRNSAKTYFSADKNNNGKLSSEELENFIQENTLKHLDDAVAESKKVFDIIDANSDGTSFDLSVTLYSTKN